MKITNTQVWLALLLGAAPLPSLAASDAQETEVIKVVGAEDGDKEVASSADRKKSLVIKRIEAGGDAAEKERAWLGVGLGEPDEALVAQLGLQGGAGLVVTYVAKDSPAEKAGIQKNDVLLELEDQTLVLPGQLQKLIQARKEGDKVKIRLLRGGKKETVTATLGKKKFADLGGDGNNAFVWHADNPGAMAFKFGGHGDPADHMVVLRKALENAKVDQKRIEVEVKRSVDEARKAMEEALRATKDAGRHGAMRKELEALAKAGVFVPNDANVVVRTTEKSSKSMVKTDESGTLVLVKNPRLRLTAHDRDGKMLFDGEVETKEQREKVPDDLKTKVEPMIEKFASDANE